MSPQPLLYTTLAPWFHLVTAPADYADEADAAWRLLSAECDGPLRTMLELGSGGGNNASHLERRAALTLVDLSPEMLDVSRGLNPECEHVVGDMRDVRLGRTFDAVFVHDAVSYITSEEDLARVLRTVAAHLRPGGAALLCPDFVRETFIDRDGGGGHDGEGRSVRYTEEFRRRDDTTYTVRCAFTLRDGDAVETVEDTHLCGLFDRATWLRLAHDAGLEGARWIFSSEHSSDSAGGDVMIARRRQA